jgi:leucyl/phenylalanyl-tRNA--protein transferase
MPIFLLPDDVPADVDAVDFPPVDQAEPNGLLAVGGDLDPYRLIAAYRAGIFPWYSNPAGPVLWWSPDPRMILLPEWLHVSRSLQKRLRRGDFTVTFNQAFTRVIAECARVRRDGEEGTWITREMEQAYGALHRMGVAISAEAWQDDMDGPAHLVGGLYGVQLGRCFFGESMFYRVPDASKIAFVTLVYQLMHQGCTLIDCQMKTDHLARFGARPVPRQEFMVRLREAL